MELNYDGFYVSGATNPGIPLFSLGKTPHMFWTITSALTDVSDLFREKLSENATHYLVDHKWRDLKIRIEEINIKGKTEPFRLEVKSTHRGPLVDTKLLAKAEVLFAEGLPSKSSNVYSL